MWVIFFARHRGKRKDIGLTTKDGSLTTKMNMENAATKSMVVTMLGQCFPKCGILTTAYIR